MDSTLFGYKNVSFRNKRDVFLTKNVKMHKKKTAKLCKIVIWCIYF